MDQAAARALDRDTHGEAVTATAVKPANKDRRENPIFNHRELDEYGLTPNEFRVYARISRRAGETGVCYESIPNIAEGIGLSACTVRRCCQVLTLARLITESNREGYTTDRRITSMSLWQNKADLPGIRKIVLRGEKTRTPITSDRGISKDTPRTSDRGGLSPATGAPLSQQTGLPLSPATDEGNPSEGSPSEVNPKKEIPHTHGAEVVERGVTCEVVCVAIPFDLDQVRRQYAEAHSFPHSKQIKNPGGWLITARDGRYDDIILEWWREQERIAEQRAAAEVRAEAERIERARMEEESRAERERLDKLKAEEWERNAPQREQERLESERRERDKIVSSCKLFQRSFANNPNLRKSLIDSTLGGDPQARADFEAWLESEGKATAAA
jgi:hypothetical protein